MLLELVIKDFAIIDSLNLAFKKGLNILSGETGAGKSIIVGAVSLLLGGRAYSELIRSEKDAAVVEAVFDINDSSEVKRLLKSLGITAEDDQLIIRRIILKSGKNRIYINDQLGNVQMLSQIGGALIDISGQYSQQLLLQTEGHINIVDIFGVHDELCGQYRECYDDFFDTLDELNALVQKEDELKSKKDLYVFQNDELKKASLDPAEEEALIKEKNILINAKDLHDKTYGVYVEMYENDNSYISAIKGAYRNIEEAASIDEVLEEQRQSLESIILELEDNAQSLRSYAEKVNIDPDRLEQVESRLDVIYRLRKKYNKTIVELIEYQKMIESDLYKIESFSDDINKLKDKLKTNSDTLWTLADKLSEKRKKASANLRKRVEIELKSIGMEKTDFHVEIKSHTRSDNDDPKSFVHGLDILGKDEVEFFISPNRGEEKKPLSKIASGGELSRIVLAIKKIMAEKYLIPTLLFDEVDTGIGGSVADSVGTKLNEISRSHQVLCITHLPQIACFANHHFNVTKSLADNRTVTKVELLGEKSRIDEISRMLGGKNITDKTIAHAVEMLKTAQNI
jgi:DNA repair protein RecN (Recombination protein N)